MKHIKPDLHNIATRRQRLHATRAQLLLRGDEAGLEFIDQELADLSELARAARRQTTSQTKEITHGA